MSSLTKMKAETESRLVQQKKIQERRRNIIILIEKYLLGIGYIDAVTKIQQQSNISLANWDTADNIDLYMVVLQFEQYYEMRFGKFPKLCKKVDDPSSYEQLKKAALKYKQTTASINKEGSVDNRDHSKAMPPKPNFKKNSSRETPKQQEKSQKDDKSQSGDNSIEIKGSAVSKKKEEDDDFYDVRVSKGIPDYSDVPEYRELASYLQRDICIQNPNVRFQDIVGLDDAKRLLKQAVQLPLKYPYLFQGILEPWRGVLLFGPPGTGKTMLAKAVATECKTTFFNISASTVVSKWRGESEKLIRVLFDLARHYQPSTIFLDELDSIMSERSGSGTEHQGSRRMKTQLLIQMDGLMRNKERVFLLAASNLPWDLDPAMLRRLEKRILVPLPCLEARQDMIRKYITDEMVDNDFPYEEVAHKTEKYSGSDIRLLCKEAAMKPLRRLLYQLQGLEVKDKDINVKRRQAAIKQKDERVKPGPVTMQDIHAALKTTKPSPSQHTQKYIEWVESYGSL